MHMGQDWNMYVPVLEQQKNLTTTVKVPFFGQTTTMQAKKGPTNSGATVPLRRVFFLSLWGDIISERGSGSAYLCTENNGNGNNTAGKGAEYGSLPSQQSMKTQTFCKPYADSPLGSVLLYVH